MTREETVSILSILKAAYPYAYKDMKRDEALNVVELWATEFRTVPFEAMKIAVKDLIKTSKFLPPIQEVTEKLNDVYWMAFETILTEGALLTTEERAFLEKVMNSCEPSGGGLKLEAPSQ